MDALHMFGCGITKKVFESKLNSLDQENQKRLERVARRIWVTDKMKYETNIFHNRFESSFSYTQFIDNDLSATRIYLLVTCLDTLAGKLYMEFPDWIKAQPEKILASKDEIINLYQQYIKDFGVGKKLRDLFNDLPTAMKKWLSTNIAIYKTEEPFLRKDQPDDKLLLKLYKYFYNIRRNSFTHNSITRQALTAEDIKCPDQSNCWVTPASGTFFILNKNRPNQLWNFSYRKGLDEATILQLIIHSAAMRILKIPVTEELINLNLHKISRLDGLYSLISEVEMNASMLRSLFNIDEATKNEIKSYLNQAGVPILSNLAATRMLERFDISHNWEKEYHRITDQYIQTVENINSKITNFNEQISQDKLNQGKFDNKWELIKKFLEEFSKDPLVKSIIKLPDTNEMINLWLIIRNPCYI